MNKLALLASCIFFLLFCPFYGVSAQESLTGLEIIQKQDSMNQHFQDEMSNSEMVIISASGQKTIRKFVFKILENIENGDKTIMKFTEPADIRDTALLTFENKTRDDDQWLYLPALKRVKRISSSKKSASFMGSEFTFEDLSPKEIRKYEYTRQKDEACGVFQCYVVDSKPLFDHSGYSKIRLWIRSDNFQNVREEFYDKKGKRLKHSTISGLKKFNEKFWRADSLHMVNVQNQRQTLLTNHTRTLGNGFGGNDFTKQAIQR
jgi:outer membrane lipoprotein-sorting protein